jgi:hypothetical protein
MLQLLAQTTQPDSFWTPAAITALSAAAVVLIGALSAAIVAVIKASKNQAAIARLAQHVGMRLPLILAVAFIAVGATGCQQTIATQQIEVQDATWLGTEGALVAIPDQGVKIQVARELYDVSTSISAAVESNGTINLADLDALANNDLAQWNSPLEPIVGSVIKILESVVGTYVADYYSSASTASQAEDVGLLIGSGAAGISSASEAFTAGVPAGVLSASPLKSTGRIPVTHHTWNGWQPTAK